MRYLVGVALGFTASRLLYDVMHKPDFPELGRYALGVVLVAITAGVFGAGREECERILLSGLACGGGVAIARIVS